MIKHQIVGDRTLQPGDRVPSAHEFAVAFGVNENTALRSLRLLRNEGLIDFRRGKPITVTTSVPPAAFSVLELVRALLDEALTVGFTRENLIAVLDEVIASAIAAKEGHEQVDKTLADLVQDIRHPRAPREAQ